MGAKWPLVFSDSLTTWTHLAARPRSNRPDRFIAVADPDIPTVASNSAFASQISTLPKLPGARAEANALKLAAPTLTDTLFGADASEIRVRAAAPHARLLHFAVHALLDAQQPLDSALVLQSTDTTAEGDGLLHVHEVLEDLHLSADLVVLSGCDTARGQAFQGEGLIGFTRAFQFAGADAVMASLWPVSDRPTAEFMDKFYHNLLHGTGAATSLQLALRDTINSAEPLVLAETRGAGALARSTPVIHAHPYVWASFQLYGGAQ